MADFSHLNPFCRWIICIFICVFMLHPVLTYRILVSMPYGTRSHKNVIIPLLRGLVQRQHSLTIITNEEIPEFKDNIHVKEIVIKDLNFILQSTNNTTHSFDTLTQDSAYTKWKLTLDYSNITNDVTWKMYSNVQVQKMLREDYFDLVVLSHTASQSGYAFAWHFQCPFVIFSPNVLMMESAFILGDHEHPEYVPFVLSPYSDHMNLKERVFNTLITYSFSAINMYISLPAAEKAVRHFLPECPSLREIEKNVSAIFVNSHPSINYPRSNPPTVVEVGALHCHPANPLPADLEEYVTDSDEGFLVFAVGSVISMNEMPPRIRDIFLRVFSRLTVKVLWQWKESNVTDLPPNIRLLNWLPQQDLLGHRKCRGFLSHGGLLSTQEAVFHGVPIIGLPFITDQKLNIKRVVQHGYGLQLDWKDIDDQLLYEAIQQILYNSSYKINALRLQALLRDQPETPLERGLYWTEYVIRHHGATHLRLASRHLSRLQRSLADVYFILIGIISIPPILLLACLRFLYSKYWKRRNSVKTTKTD